MVKLSYRVKETMTSTKKKTKKKRKWKTFKIQNDFLYKDDKNKTKNQQWTKTFGKLNIKPKLGQKRVLRNILLEAKELR